MSISGQIFLSRRELLLHYGVLVRENLFPLQRWEHRKGHPGFEVGLVETREHFVSKIGLEFSIEVLLGVNVDETNASAAVVVVIVEVVHSHSIWAHFQSAHSEMDESLLVLQLYLLAVLEHSDDLPAVEIEDKFGRYGGQVKEDLCVAGVGLAFLEADVEAIKDWAVFDVLRALLCSLLGESHCLKISLIISQ
jgi:hypothetical protein